MSKKVRIELNSSGVRELLRGPEIQGDIGRRAGAIAQAAAGNSPDGGEFGHDVTTGRNRAHGMVWTADFDAIRAEAIHRALTRAIDAGRH